MMATIKKKKKHTIKSDIVAWIFDKILKPNSEKDY